MKKTILTAVILITSFSLFGQNSSYNLWVRNSIRLKTNTVTYMYPDSTINPDYLRTYFGTTFADSAGNLADTSWVRNEINDTITKYQLGISGDSTLIGGHFKVDSLIYQRDTSLIDLINKYGGTPFSFGAEGQMPYMNPAGTDFGYGGLDFKDDTLSITGHTVVDSNLIAFEKVGIGTAAPQSSLHIANNGGVTEGITLGGDGDSGFSESSDDILVGYAGGVEGFRMVNSAGDVKIGIGEANPTKKFQVKSEKNSISFSATDALASPVAGFNFSLATIASAPSYVNIWFGDNPSSAGAIISHKITNNSPDRGELHFITRGDDGYIERLSILENGNVGIDTITPSQDFEVNGDILTDDTLFVLSPTRGDTALIFDDGDTTRLESTNPIKIGNNSLVVGNDSTVNDGALNVLGEIYKDGVPIGVSLGANGQIPVMDGTTDLSYSNNFKNEGTTFILVSSTDPGSMFIGGGGVNNIEANNTSVGVGSLLDNSEGDNNTSVGYQSMYENFSGANNAVIGYRAMYLDTDGNRNTVVGSEALYSGTSGDDNVAIGRRALYLSTTGLKNTALGTGALAANTTGDDNIAIGYNAGGAATTSNSKLYIDNSSTDTLIYGDFANDSLAINGVFTTLNPKFYVSFSDSVEVIPGAVDVYSQLTGNVGALFTNYRNRGGFVFQGDSVQIPSVPGFYELKFSTSFQGNANDVWHIDFFVDNVEIENRASRERSTSNAAIGSCSSFMDYYFTGGEWVKIMVKNTVNNNDMTTISCDWSIKYDE